jgi:hypothetical protein
MKESNDERGSTPGNADVRCDGRTMRFFCCCWIHSFDSSLEICKGDQKIPRARGDWNAAVHQVSGVQQNLALFQLHDLVHRGNKGAAAGVGVAPRERHIGRNITAIAVQFDCFAAKGRDDETTGERV